jgi:D-glycero-D-manno-heptose 1,7-bisphosphate phosphatase
MWTISPNYTLFLDRDGVINRKIAQSYVLKWSEFEFIDGALPAIAHLSRLFGRIIGVTNQQGIGKKMMLETDLIAIMKQMGNCVAQAGGRIDTFYYCPHLEGAHCACRKPRIGMATQAKTDYPDIDLAQAFMVGDSISDMHFGRNCGMKTIFISNNEPPLDKHRHLIDAIYNNLADFAADCEANEKMV